MTTMTPEKMQSIIEAALMVAGQPLTITAMQNLFPEEEKPDNATIKDLITAINTRHQDSGIEVKELATGFRFQAKADYSPWLSRLWEERAPRYSRAFLETLVIIAYKQPITRAEIEDIRGVTVSSHIIKTLQDREWIRVVGYREIPGRPGIYGTTKDFLDYFNLKSLSELPTLAELKNLEAQEAKLQVQLALEESQIGAADSEVIPEERDAIVTETTAEGDTPEGITMSDETSESADTEEIIEIIEVSDTIEVAVMGETEELAANDDTNELAMSETIEIIEDDISDEDNDDTLVNATT